MDEEGDVVFTGQNQEELATGPTLALLQQVGPQEEGAGGGGPPAAQATAAGTGAAPAAGRKASIEDLAEARVEVQRLVQDYYKLDFEDNIEGLKTRFRYKEVDTPGFRGTVVR